MKSIESWHNLFLLSHKTKEPSILLNGTIQADYKIGPLNYYNREVYSEAVPREIMYKLQLFCNLFRLNHCENIKDPKHKFLSPKVEFLIRILNICSVRGLKVVIYSKELSFFDYLESTITNLFQISLRGSTASTFSFGLNRWKNGVNYLRIVNTNSLTPKENNFLNNFNSENVPWAVLCLAHVQPNMRDCNFVGASVVICMEPMNEFYNMRCLTSVYRINQTRPVTFITMASKVASIFCVFNLFKEYTGRIFDKESIYAIRYSFYQPFSTIG